MKITKLIIPLLGLTTINNANKELLQVEKTPEISYEISATDNWDNYYYLTDTNATENLVQNEVMQLNAQNILAESPIQLSPQDGCDDLFRSIMNTCNRMTGEAKIGCVAAAWASYWACMLG